MNFINPSKRDALCYHYLTRLYDEMARQMPYRPPADYGEILFEGASMLLSKTEMTSEDIFVDLGSGRGKLVSQIFLQTNVKEAYGIELVMDLHEQAKMACEQIHSELPEFFYPNRQLACYHANFLNYPFMPMTISFLNSVCFTPTLMHAIGTLLNEIETLHTIFSMRPIPSLKMFKFKSSFKMECTWDSALCYIYQRSK